MRNRILALWLAAAGFGLLDCSHKPKFEAAKIDRFAELQAKKKKLNEKGILAEVAIGESRDLQAGIDKAELEARAKLARSLEAHASSLSKKFEEEVGPELSGHFSQTIKTVSDETLRGAGLQETLFEQDGEGRYRVFGLMVLDASLYQKAMATELEADKAMRDRWRASKAYKELNSEIEAYREWKRKEAPLPETQPPAEQGS
jgi:hypothetical protein